MLKKKLRKSAKDFRKQLAFDVKSQKDEIIFEKIINLPQFLDSEIVLCYYSTDIEVDTLKIIEHSMVLGKKVALPKCVDSNGEMVFKFITSFDDVKKGYFDICEPLEDLPEYDFLSENAICIIPSLMVDKLNYRLGYGKGYYDRFLSKFSGFKCVLCYKENLTDELPIYDDFDVKCDLCITD